MLRAAPASANPAARSLDRGLYDLPHPDANPVGWLACGVVFYMSFFQAHDDPTRACCVICYVLTLCNMF